MKTGKKICLLLLAIILKTGCNQDTQLDLLTNSDLYPPELVRISNSEKNLSIEFNEEVNTIKDSIRISPDPGIENIQARGNTISIKFSGNQIPGKEYLLEAAVEDIKGNSTGFITPFYGFNPHIPGLCINEFTTQGSGKHPDVVEIFILSDGDMAGVTFYQGIHGNWSSRFIFPSVKVKNGDYILIHTKPRNIPEEKNETVSRTESGGYDASDNAFDFWLAEGKGLSGNNGVLSVFSSPDGSLIDGLLYSNRDSSSDEKYRGFGTARVLYRADELAAALGWKFQNRKISPEDGINPDDSTGTRSICRNSNSEDTDTRDDWHIVPTRGATFGTKNKDEVY